MTRPRWFALARVWDHLLGRSAGAVSPPPPPVALTFLALEDRITPTGRPLPDPYLFVGSAAGAVATVKAYRADTGELAFTKEPFGSFTGGVSVAAGDIDGDGIPDLIAAAGAGGGPRVVVYSGADGSVIRDFYAYDTSFTGGVNVAAGDMDGDGRADVITAAGAGGGPHVKVFSGADGSVLASFYAFAPEFRGGASVAAADFTGDGKADLVVGAGSGGGPHVRVFDVSTGLPVPGPLGSFYAFDSSFTGGVSVGTDGLSGDVTGDGVPDVVVGAGPGGGPNVRVFDGVTGEKVRDFMAFDSSFSGGVSVATAFVDDDANADLIVGQGSGGGAVKVFGGADSMELSSPMSGYAPFGTSFTGGVAVAGSNDPTPSSITSGFAGGSSYAPGQAFTLTATVSGAGMPTGSVTWTAYPTGGGTPFTLGTAFITPGPGTASLFVSGGIAGSGTYSIRAKYSGDATFAASQVYFTGTVGSGYAVLAPRPDAGAAGAGAVREDGTTEIPLVPGIGGDGFGPVLDGAVYWSNADGYADGAAGGGTQWAALPRVKESYPGTGTMALVTGGNTARFYSLNGGGGYDSLFGDTSAFADNTTTHQFTITESNGGKWVFNDLSTAVAAEARGQFVSYTDPAGNAVSVVNWDSTGRVTTLQKVDSAGTTEQLTFAYGSNERLLGVTRQRKPSGGSYTTVRQLNFSYVTPSGAAVPSLSGVTELDGSGTTLGQTYDRYSGTIPTYGQGNVGKLTYHLGEAATARLQAAYSGTALSALTDAQVAAYADYALGYDSSNRVSSVTSSAAVAGGSGGGSAVSVAYSTRASTTGSVNEWIGKTTQTLADGTVTRTYTNAKGQVLLTAVSEATSPYRTWVTYTKYDTSGRAILQAAPSAVSGYDEALSDLVGWSGSSATYLRSGDGLISTTTYASTTTATSTTAGDAAGYVSGTAIQRGTGGTPVPQSAYTYFKRTAGRYDTFPVATETRYRNDNGTGAETTSYSYTWQGSTAQAYSVTTTLPTVTSGENGPGTAATSTVVYDSFGRPIWAKDAAGVLSYTAYDALTGAVVKTIADVNTANTSDFANLPSGWSTPSGAGYHYITTYEVDSLGRTTKSTDPLGHITYTVYNDANHEVRTYPGWNTSTSAPTGPTQVSREDLAGGYSETLTMTATPATSSGRPTGTESVSGVQSLSRTYRNTAGQTTYQDSYFDLTGVTYSTSTSLGTQNTNFYRTETDYDTDGRANRSVSAAGTITRTVLDAMGRGVATWVGTDDTPTTGSWSTSNLTGTNTVQVSATEYDGGSVGDGLVTKETSYPGGSAAARVTQTWSDWRDRAVGVKQGVETTESTSVNRPLTYTEYDNLGAAVTSESYDGDGVSLTDGNSDGVPDRPSSSLLRAKTVTSTDEQGRTYKTETYAVDPSSGSVSTYALTSQTWFDIRGLTLKTSAPGGVVTKTAYDSLGQAITVYTSDGGGDSGWSDAGTVTGDTVLSQTETGYDADGNAVLTTTRERMHDATGTGSLGSVGSGIAARVSFQTTYYDLGNRVTDSVAVGTNGGSTWSRPSSVPSRSDTVLVSSTAYDSAGRTWKATDPRGIETRTTYDLMGRVTKTVENYVDGVVSDTDDKTTEYAYGPAGRTSLTADLTGGGFQTTQWVYGVTQSGGSNIDSYDIVGATRWPDPSTGAASSGQQESVTVSALGQTLTATDRNGTVHTLTYDILGRVTVDAVTTLGSGVDGSVRRVETAYDGQGNPYLLTTYDAASSGSIVTQTQRAYNGLGQLVTEWQSRGAAVNTSTSPKVQYAYSTLGTDNRSRLTSVTYPSGYVLTYNYTSGINSDVSRLSSLSDTSGTVEGYDYLGTGTVVRRTHPLSGVDLTYIKLSTESVGDAGDQYIGLDRFGRVVDQRWRTSVADVERVLYGYDRDGNRTSKTNTVNSAYNEAYGYDGFNQLTSFNRNSGARTQAFDYDAVGNWDSLTTNGGTPQTRSANKQNEITAVSGATTPTYDSNGNMTGDETGKQFVYDAWNRLKVVKNSGGTTLVTYTYDAGGRRVAETASGTTTDLYYSSQWQVLEEAVSGTATKRYVWSPVYVDALILRDRDTNADGTLDERLWAMQDANWNVTGLVNSSGTVVERYAYDPYGAVTVMNGSWSVLSSSAYGWQYLMQGTRRDSVTGWDEHERRWYSPTLGRWASNDPMGYDAGDVNLYRGIANNAVTYTDPSGQFLPFVIVGAAAIVVLAGASTAQAPTRPNEFVHVDTTSDAAEILALPVAVATLPRVVVIGGAFISMDGHNNGQFQRVAVVVATDRLFRTPEVPKVPASRSLTNIEVRDWYRARLADLDEIELLMRTQNKSAKEIAQKLHELRNTVKLRARDMMQDQAAAESLPPPITWEEVVKKYDGDYEKIIQKSRFSNKAVDKAIEEKRLGGGEITWLI